MERPLTLTTQVLASDACFTTVRATLTTVQALTDPTQYMSNPTTSAAVLAEAGLSHSLYAYDVVQVSVTAGTGTYKYVFDLRFSTSATPDAGCAPQATISKMAEVVGIRSLALNFIPRGYGFVVVAGGVRLADTTGLALGIPAGIAIKDSMGGSLEYFATGGVRPASETGLGSGVACPVGLNSLGQLVRAYDASCVPGFYIGDCDTVGDVTIRVRETPVISSYAQLVWAQPVWDIDPVNGSDQNTGLLGQPIKTFMEQHRRVGRHEVDGEMTSSTPKVLVLIRDNLLATDQMRIDLVTTSRKAFPTNNTQIPYQVRGTPKKVISGTITNVRAFDHANNVTWGMASNISLSSHIVPGRYLQRTNIVTDYPATWWLAKNEDGITFRTSYPAAFTATDPVNANIASLVTNDTFDVYDLPTIGQHDIRVSNSGTYDVIFDRVRFTGPALQSNGNIVMTRCATDNSILFSEYFLATNCQHNGLVTTNKKTRTYHTYGLFLNTTRLWAGQPTFQNYTMFQGGSSLTTDGGVNYHCHTRGFQIYDQTGDGIVIHPGDQLLLAGGVIGTGNSGYGVNVQRGGRIIVGGLGPTGGRFFRLLGAAGDIMVAGKTSGPAIQTTNPYGYTADIPYTHDNFNLPVSGGGFGLNIPCPTAPGVGIFSDTVPT